MTDAPIYRADPPRGPFNKEEKQVGVLDKISMGNMDETRGHEDSNMGIRGMIETSEDSAEVRGRENFNTKDVAASEAQMS